MEQHGGVVRPEVLLRFWAGWQPPQGWFLAPTYLQPPSPFGLASLCSEHLLTQAQLSIPLPCHYWSLL